MAIPAGDFTVASLERACELLWQSGNPRIAESLEAEVKALTADRDRLLAVLYPPAKLNRKQRRALQHGDSLASQLDHGEGQHG